MSPQVIEGTLDQIVTQMSKLPPAALSAEEEEYLLDELSASTPNLPILPPEANRREWMYQER